MSRMPQPPAPTARSRRVAGLLVALLPAAAPGQEPIDRLLYADAASYLASPDPRVRGEAALVVAAAGDPRAYDAILPIAKDQDEPARWRGLLALGYLGEPSAQHVFDPLLAESAARPRPGGIVAAFALGLLPDGPAEATVTRQLLGFLESSMKRQRDMVLALTTALASRGATTQLGALRQLYSDDALRDPGVRAALLLAMLRIPEAVSSEAGQRILDGGTVAERRTLLAAIADGVLVGDSFRTEDLERIADRDGDATTRALALAALTRKRHLPALDRAARAIRSDRPAEIEQGTRTALLLGGAPMRRPIECQLELLSPRGKVALLDGFSGPMSDAFATTCLDLTRSHTTAAELRLAAALALSRAEVAAVTPSLIDLFTNASEARQLVAIAQALIPTPEAAPPLERLHRGDHLEDLALATDRLAALLIAGHPQASRFCVEQLQRKDLLPNAAASLLRAIRTARLGPLPAPLRELVPEPVRTLLP